MGDAGAVQRILLVDDEEAWAWSSYRRLRQVRPKYRVKTVVDGGKALVSPKQQNRSWSRP